MKFAPQPPITRDVDPVTAGGLSAPSTTSSTATAAKTGAVSSNLPATSSFHDDLTKATEKLQPVGGHAYSKVMSGAREGLYVNTSHNSRAGETFAIEYHGGRRWNVYGEGKDRVVIAFAKPKPATDAAATAPASAATATTPAAPATTPAATATTPAATAVSPAYSAGTSGVAS